LGGFNRDVAQAGDSQQVLAVFCRYLGDKLAMTSDALTYLDVEGPLQRRGVGEESLGKIRRLFTTGEASRFAGGSDAGEAGAAREQAMALAKELERVLR
jgi:hypothetical protein